MTSVCPRRRPRAHAAASTVHVARQPIHDVSGRLFGYELLFRDTALAGTAGSDDDSATTSTILAAFSEFGGENLLGGKPGFINLTRAFLVGQLPLPFSPDGGRARGARDGRRGRRAGGRRPAARRRGLPAGARRLHLAARRRAPAGDRGPREDRRPGPRLGRRPRDPRGLPAVRRDVPGREGRGRGRAEPLRRRRLRAVPGLPPRTPGDDERRDRHPRARARPSTSSAGSATPPRRRRTSRTPSAATPRSATGCCGSRTRPRPG